MKRPLLAIPLFTLLTACSPGSDPGTGKPVVSVSILPQKFFVESLAGNLVDVNVMIPPGASPATYDPTPSQLGQLNRSELYLKVGYLGFELSWMERMLAASPSMKVIDLSEGIRLIHGEDHEDRVSPHGHGGIDPHIWMSVPNARVIADHIYEALCALLPSEKELLARNRSAMMASLDTLDAQILEMLNGLDQRSVMIFHPALTYFARDYGLEQLPLEAEGKAPSPSHMKQMADLGKEKRIGLVLIQAEFDRKNAEILAEEIGAEILQIDPLSPDWYGQMLYIANKIKSSHQ